jgi:[ribosomal protein S5]-alanine N-acetyltransferase
MGEFLGTCGFWQGKGWRASLPGGYCLNARREGVAAEASRAAIKHAYDTFQWDSVETYMKDDNQAARALALRLEGQQIDRRLFPDGIDRDVFRFPRPSVAAYKTSQPTGLE